MGTVISRFRGEKMNRLHLDVPSLTRSLIGFDKLFHEAERRIATTNYPPHNILKINENEYEIEFAVAGFTQAELELQFDKGQLTVIGKHTEQRQVEYLHQGLAYRSFVKSIGLTEYLEVIGADLKNGILRVRLERKVPEALKPKLIEIK